MVQSTKDLITHIYLICYIHCFQEKISSKALSLKVLNLSFLTNSELSKWLEQVSNYTEEIINKLCRREAIEDESFVSYVLQYLNVKHNCNYTKAVFKDINISQEMALARSVEALHTGSVPEQYGKPTSALKDLEPLVRDAFQEVESDHDLMVELLKYPVHFRTREEMDFKKKEVLTSAEGNMIMALLEKNQRLRSCTWILQFIVVPISDDSEFVDLYIEGFEESCQFIFQVPNILARNYLKMLFDSIELEHFLRIPVDISNSKPDVTVTYQGPAVNISAFGNETNILDVDLLLALPLYVWPR